MKLQQLKNYFVPSKNVNNKRSAAFHEDAPEAKRTNWQIVQGYDNLGINVSRSRLDRMVSKTGNSLSRCLPEGGWSMPGSRSGSQTNLVKGLNTGSASPEQTRSETPAPSLQRAGSSLSIRSIASSASTLFNRELRDLRSSRVESIVFGFDDGSVPTDTTNQSFSSLNTFNIANQESLGSIPTRDPNRFKRHWFKVPRTDYYVVRDDMPYNGAELSVYRPRIKHLGLRKESVDYHGIPLERMGANCVWAESKAQKVLGVGDLEVGVLPMQFEAKRAYNILRQVFPEAWANRTARGNFWGEGKLIIYHASHVGPCSLLADDDLSDDDLSDDDLSDDDILLADIAPQQSRPSSRAPRLTHDRTAQGPVPAFPELNLSQAQPRQGAASELPPLLPGPPPPVRNPNHLLSYRAPPARPRRANDGQPPVRLAQAPGPFSRARGGTTISEASGDSDSNTALADFIGDNNYRMRLETVNELHELHELSQLEWL